MPQYITTYTQTLADVSDFSATISPDGTVTSLSFVMGPETTIHYDSTVLTASTVDGALDYTTSGSDTGEVYPAGTFVQVVPEPASLGLMSLGAMGLLARRRRA